MMYKEFLDANCYVQALNKTISKLLIYREGGDGADITRDPKPQQKEAFKKKAMVEWYTYGPVETHV